MKSSAHEPLQAALKNFHGAGAELAGLNKLLTDTAARGSATSAPSGARTKRLRRHFPHSPHGSAPMRHTWPQPHLDEP